MTNSDTRLTFCTTNTDENGIITLRDDSGTAMNVSNTRAVLGATVISPQYAYIDQLVINSGNTWRARIYGQQEGGYKPLPSTGVIVAFYRVMPT